ncbi:MAG TPA: hypothetical protein PKC54_03035 [Ferruginibacter sp.]|nr:hypothetical protein [Ferruginibacter sp.]
MFSLKTRNIYYRLLFYPAVLPAVLIFLFSCNEKKEDRLVERSFYYWRSVLKLTEFEKQQLDSLKVRTIYIKFFDVDWNEESRSPVPVAKLQTTNYKVPETIQVIPTVFITNECIQKIDSSQVAELASRIHTLIQDIRGSNSFNSIKEIQIDCDWTQATKEKYFRLLNNLKLILSVAEGKTPNFKLSSTIRLHQIKFLAKTGVPPVDCGLLMCYNMGNLKNPATNNSILETEELKKYIGNLSNYPLPLDVAFPLFDWKVLYRNNTYTGLIQNLPDKNLTDAFTIRAGNRYEILKDTLLNGFDLKKGDIIRNEQCDVKEILSAAAEVNRLLKNTQLRVSLYHLDSVILNKYTTHELESIYNSLR